MQKVIVAAVVLFLGYFLITQPENAAGIVEQMWGVLVGLFDGIVNFIGELFN